MVYSVYIKYYDELNTRTRVDSCFVIGESYLDITQQMSTYYGNNCIEEIHIESISPDNFIVFKEEDKDIFTKTKRMILDDVVW